MRTRVEPDTEKGEENKDKDHGLRLSNSGRIPRSGLAVLSSISRTQGQIVILSDLHLELSMSKANEIQFAYTFGLGKSFKGFDRN